MTDAVIRAEGIGKRYRIGARRASCGSLREAVVSAARRIATAPFRAVARLSGRPSGEDELIWALKDVSFEVRRGEVVGVIGPNGAGKTTLLKVLSRITEPTEGRAEIRGRVGSLLEVGTGFHPELTGRENVYLNGAILGMKRREIRAKFDEIVAFAEIDRFIDTPVKRYSAGMHTRLAFAVAAHLEPEILLVDEVLAVGDAAFQKKCLGKMGDVAKEGRTVLFVSHNMAAITSLCEKALLVETGHIVRSGAAYEVVHAYVQSSLSARVPTSLEDRKDRGGDGSIRITALSIANADSDGPIRCTSRLKVTIGYRGAHILKPPPQFLVGIYDYRGTGVFLLDSDAGSGLPQDIPSEGHITCITDPINLTPGPCFVNVAILKSGGLVDHLTDAGHLDVEEEDVYGSGKMPPRSWMLCTLPHRWYFDEGGQGNARHTN